ncbi:N-acetyltransferase [Clostridium botulinum]|uniref:GNAT family N-acetyltransferase n=1 Tax=Clostridium botulinum TaxID=1491 RepID=UPI0013F07E34|nr:GNAT family N-acetyltransferase [Clostridium botulinum]MCS6104154.1 N-acetyltransferase [Clostridium botulinum]MCS6107139.1 N-acetyltransferase [Clostridium botulinum]NFG23408.1 GNAT family N-acetyltransferase [Clostridium botulinum]NFR13080.1 GNAT family N-acetyltransferase [Clostridium botulinum]NFR42927.1 GNAT family N-acetyltransferase [Clostridium botulinum]
MRIKLRRCNENDIDIVYKLSNDSSIRCNSFNKNPISYEEHYKWYNNSLNNSNRIMYLIMLNELIIGQIRLDKKYYTGEISFSLDSCYRGKGYGKEALKLIENEALKNEILVLEGNVLKDNISSRNVFTKNGFVEIDENEYFRYVYLLNNDKKN